LKRYSARTGNLAFAKLTSSSFRFDFAVSALPRSGFSQSPFSEMRVDLRRAKEREARGPEGKGKIKEVGFDLENRLSCLLEKEA